MDFSQTLKKIIVSSLTFILHHLEMDISLHENKVTNAFKIIYHHLMN